MIKSFFYKLLISVFTFVIILSSVYFMCGGKNVAADISLQISARKNSKNISDEVTLPKNIAKADQSVMRTESVKLTEEDLRSIYIGGTRYDFPCTLADLNKEYEVFITYQEYKEEFDTYTGSAVVYCNGIPIFLASYHCPDKEQPFDKCVVGRLLSAYFTDHSEEYTPQIVFAGMDIYNTSYDEMLYLTALEEAGYISNRNVYFSVSDKYSGYVYLEIPRIPTVTNSGIELFSNIEFIPDYDEKSIDRIKGKSFMIFAEEIRLPEDYSPEKYPALPLEEYPEIIYNDENITPDIKEYGMTAYELMFKAGIDSLPIVSCYSVSDNPDYLVIKCSLEYNNVLFLLRDGQDMGEASVFYAGDSIMEMITTDQTP